MSSLYNVTTDPGLAERHQGSDGDAHDGGGCQDSASPVSPSWIGVDGAVILLHRELRHLGYLQDDNELDTRNMKI